MSPPFSPWVQERGVGVRERWSDVLVSFLGGTGREWVGVESNPRGFVRGVLTVRTLGEVLDRVHTLFNGYSLYKRIGLRTPSYSNSIFPHTSPFFWAFRSTSLNHMSFYKTHGVLCIRDYLFSQTSVYGLQFVGIVSADPTESDSLIVSKDLSPFTVDFSGGPSSRPRPRTGKKKQVSGFPRRPGKW